jgi:hypothetical protein
MRTKILNRYFHEVRSRLFRQVVELMRSKHIAAGPLEGGAQAAASFTNDSPGMKAKHRQGVDRFLAAKAPFFR